MVADCARCPFAAVGVAIGAAFGFAYDDVKYFLSGNQSVIGELSKSFPLLGEAVRGWAEAVKGYFTFLGDSLSSGLSLIEFVLGFIAALFTKAGGVIGNIAKGVVDAWVDAFPQLTTIFKAIGGIIEWLGGVFKSVFGWIFETIAALPKAFGHWADDINKETAKLKPPGGKGAPSTKPAPGHAAAQEGPERS